MTSDVKEHCLEPFFTAKEARGGTGLGLAVVSSIIRRHHGNVEIQSDPGEGALFRITLPAQKGAGSRAIEKHEKAPSQLLRILVVDDEPLVRKVVSRFLTADGHEVVTAANGREAITAFKEAEFDLVLTDWAMPKMTGSLLAEAVKNERPEVPVAIMTGVESGMPEVTPKGAAVDIVVKKPLTRDKLRQAVRVSREHQPTPAPQL
jgi:CheY-like chemotaxis protein